MRRRNKKINQKGIGLIEVIAALGLSILVLTSLVSLSLFTVRSSLQSKLMLEGTKQANKQMELVRAFRDASLWDDQFVGQIISNNCHPGGSSCHIDDSANPFSVSCGAQVIGSGAEQLNVSFIAYNPDTGVPLQSGDQEARIAVEVSWEIAGDTKYARLYTDLTNWANR